MAHFSDLFTHTHTHATGTIPVAENLPTLYPPSIQTKPIHRYSEQRRIGTTESLPFVVFRSTISKRVPPFTLRSMRSLCHACWRLKAINCDSSDSGWEPLTPTFLCSEFCCQHENIRGRVKVGNACQRFTYILEKTTVRHGMQEKSNMKRIDNAVFALLLRREKERGAYNCQRLDFFFSWRAGLSFEALRLKENPL